MQGIKYEGKALEKYSNKMMKSVSRNNWEPSEVNHTFIIVTGTLAKKDQINYELFHQKIVNFSTKIQFQINH